MNNGNRYSTDLAYQGHTGPSRSCMLQRQPAGKAHILGRVLTQPQMLEAKPSRARVHLP